jgi:hypothetical protein
MCIWAIILRKKGFLRRHNICQAVICSAKGFREGGFILRRMQSWDFQHSAVSGGFRLLDDPLFKEAQCSAAADD